MNINRVYECELWIVYKIDYFNDNYDCSFVKKTIVYVDKYNTYHDLSTKIKYPISYSCTEGSMFIKPDTLVPISTLIDAKRDNIPKRKILKKYKEKNGGKNEKSI